MKNTKTQRAICILLILLLTITTLTPMKTNAASGKDRRKVESQVKGFFKATKRYDINKMAPYMSVNLMGKTSYITKKPISNTIKEMQKDHMKYKVQSVKVKGNKATVKVYVEYFDAEEIFDEAFRDFLAWAIKQKNRNQALGNVDKMGKYFSKRYKKRLKEYRQELRDLEEEYNEEDDDEEYPYDDEDYEDDTDYYESDLEEIKDTYLVRKPLTLNLVKKNGVWKIDKYTKHLQNAIDCGVCNQLKYIMKNVNSYVWDAYLGR